MNNIFNKYKKESLISLIATIFIFLMLIGATYAFFTEQNASLREINVTGTTETMDLLSFTIDKGISIHANADNFARNTGDLSDTATAKAYLKGNSTTGEATNNY